MISIILTNINKWTQCVKWITFNSCFSNLLKEISRHFTATTKIIINHSDFYAFLGFLTKDIKNRIKEFTRLHYKIFNKNKFLRFFKFVYHWFFTNITNFIVSYFCVFIDTRKSITVYILAYS